jgi:hypothetical protein
VGTYPTNNKDVDARFNSISYSSASPNFANTTYTVNITSIGNNLAAGTFSGVLQPTTSGSGPVITITNGTFSNLPIQ